MPIKVTCSNCGGVLHAPDDAGGKRGRCPTCGNILPIPAIGGTPTPPADSPRAARASQQSFGDIALGDKPSAPPRPAEPPPRPAEPRRQSATIPPPVDDDRPARKAKPTSPFTKPGSAAAPSGEASEGVARAWRKASGGLWWVRLAAWLFLIPILGLNGLRLYEHFAGQSLQFDGVLKQEWLPPAQELDLALFGAPVFLGLLCLVFGRLSFSGVPRKSGARGLALFAALATLAAFAGLVALLFPPVYALIEGVPPPVVTASGGGFEWQLFPTSEGMGVIQRFGLMGGVVAFLVAEFWFVGSLGRAASSLGNRRFGGRVTRFTLLMGLAAAFLLTTGTVRPAATSAEGGKFGGGSTPGFDFSGNVKRTTGEVQTVVQKEWAGLLASAVPADFAHWPAVRAGSFLLGGLLVWMMYVRMVGAGRRAIREWREQHDPTV